MPNGDSLPMVLSLASTTHHKDLPLTSLIIPKGYFTINGISLTLLSLILYQWRSAAWVWSHSHQTHSAIRDLNKRLKCDIRLTSQTHQSCSKGSWFCIYWSGRYICPFRGYKVGVVILREKLRTNALFDHTNRMLTPVFTLDSSSPGVWRFSNGAFKVSDPGFFLGRALFNNIQWIYIIFWYFWSFYYMNHLWRPLAILVISKCLRPDNQRHDVCWQQVD